MKRTNPERRSGRGGRWAGLALLIGPHVYLSAACAVVAGGADELRRPDEPPRQLALEEFARQAITPRGVAHHIEFIRSMAERNRKTDQSGVARVAAWIASEFHLANLEPAGEDGGFVQYRTEGDVGPEEPVPSVVAVLPGSDPTRAEEYVVLAARFGHGAEDTTKADHGGETSTPDVSGIAALVAVARALASLPDRPARPILFLASTDVPGTESGVAHFARHPTVNLGHAVAILGIGAVGGEADGAVVLVGDSDPSLGALLVALAEETDGMTVGLRSGGHFAFADGPELSPGPAGGPALFPRDGIPSGLLTTGVAVRDTDRQSDSGGAGAETTARLARLVLLATHRLASPAS
jgi:hypothetical protein